ncbi:hypothetical protein TanjilG_31539 [Lupinus angustifolius]|uniref:Two-component response regulator n=1 Tax=Lupinus angustifolius TaxID=3871 RepID=A0A4P1RTN0_LUPAN|nr:hypothetical protein TanjilG_31539 [Lupinus angustifolius]
MILSNGQRSSSGDDDHFPAGLRVMVVDDDPTCLMILEKMLRTCLYQVTKCNQAEIALTLLRENRNGFDIVISDVHMPDMDGFKLLEHIGLEMDLPVIMMSADDSKNAVMKGVTHGACDYLIKPVQIDSVKNVWQHVVPKKKNEWRDGEQSGSAEEGSWRSSKKKRDEDEDADERDDTSALKKPRVVWSVELHQQFVAAVEQLGIDKAVPKKILELMNVPGLTRENVASHLQKYRLYLRRVSGVSQHPNNSFLNQQNAAFGSISSINDLQTLAVSGQLPAQSLATLQAAGLGRSTAKAGVPMPLMDQRNLFNFENQRLRIGEGQQHHLSSSKSIDLLHGIPTNMEPKQLADLHQSTLSIRNLNMGVNASTTQSNPLLMQMVQSQPRGQVLSENTGLYPRLSSSLAQPSRNGIFNGPISINGTANSNRAPAQKSPMLSFPMNQTHEMSVISFPLVSTPGISSVTTKGSFQEEVTSGIRRDGGFVPSYDIFNELHHYKSNEWGITTPGLTNTSSQPSNPFQGEGLEQGNLYNADQHFNKLADNSERVKVERIPDESSQTNLFAENYAQEDLLSALLKQQEGIGPVENEYDFDGYSLDNVPV